MSETNGDIKEIMSLQSEHLQKLQQIILQSVKDQEDIASNPPNRVLEKLTTGQKISDQVARFGGSWTFIIVFSLVLLVWIAFNSLAPHGDQFDPYPYILMNLVLSTVAALQAPIIMMSQNRQEEKDRLNAENDYLVNMKAELEVRCLHQKVDILQEEQIKTLYEIQALQMEVLNRLDQKMDQILAK